MKRRQEEGKGVLFLDDSYVHILGVSQHRQMGRLPGALFELGNEIIIEEHSGHQCCGRAWSMYWHCYIRRRCRMWCREEENLFLLIELWKCFSVFLLLFWFHDLHCHSLTGCWHSCMFQWKFIYFITIYWFIHGRIQGIPYSGAFLVLPFRWDYVE